MELTSLWSYHFLIGKQVNSTNMGLELPLKSGMCTCACNLSASDEHCQMTLKCRLNLGQVQLCFFFLFFRDKAVFCRDFLGRIFSHFNVTAVHCNVTGCIFPLFTNVCSQPEHGQQSWGQSLFMANIQFCHLFKTSQHSAAWNVKCVAFGESVEFSHISKVGYS